MIKYLALVLIGMLMVGQPAVANTTKENREVNCMKMADFYGKVFISGRFKVQSENVVGKDKSIDIIVSDALEKVLILEVTRKDKTFNVCILTGWSR